LVNREKLKTHKENDVWEPPEDWNKPLPPEIGKMADNLLLKKYTDKGGELPEDFFKVEFSAILAISGGMF
jgi:hypothetical protein